MPRSTADQLKQARSFQQHGKNAEAERTYRGILKRNPNNIEAQVQLGVLLRQTGRVPEALTILESAARNRPDHLGAVGEFGSTLVAAGKFGKAEQLFQSLTARHPHAAVAHQGLAQTFLAQNKIGKALQALTKAAELAPGNALILHELGWAYQQAGQANRALGYLEKAFVRDPSSPTILRSYGHVLHIVGRLTEAQTHLEKAARKNPDHLGTIIPLSELYQSLGMLEKSKTLLEAALAKGQRHPALLVAVARVERRQKNPEKALEYLSGFTGKTANLPAQLQGTVQFELGAILEQLAEYPRAFTAYQNANQLLNYSYSPTGTTRQVDALITAYSPAAIDKLPYADNDSELPIFILGMPRSGTTLVEQIIAAHSQAFGGGELGYLGQACQPLLSGARGAWEPARLTNTETETLTNAAETYLGNLRRHHHTAPHITDKMPTNFFYLGAIAQLLPKARVVHCRRDPLDTCLSIFATPLSPALSFSTNLESLGHFYREYTRLLAHWRSVIDALGLAWLELDYEQMIDDTEFKSRELINFCRLPWEENCLKFHETKRTVSTASIHQVRQPIYRSSLQRWKRFEAQLGPLVDALGELAIR